MSLPALYAQPTDPASWQAWAWNHQANHFDIVQAGMRYQNTSLTIATNIASLSGGFVLSFASTTGVKVGMAVSDTTTPGSIATGSEVNGLNATEVQIGIALAGNVGSGDSIFFGPGANVLPLAQFQLSPVDPSNMGLWFYQHQIMHAQINQVLGTQGFNLLDYDWSDPDQLTEWLNQNASEHQTICTALGIG
jgi:hypothetical protein